MNNKTKAELCVIWLDSFYGLEYKHKKQLIDYFGDNISSSLVLNEGKEYILKELGENVYNTLRSSATAEYFNYLYKGLSEKRLNAVTLFSDDYPELLKQTDNPPVILYVKGNAEVLSGNLFSIVGSRNNLPLSIGIAKNYTEALCDGGFIPVTGIAQGIDQTVIETALSKNKKVISVLACGHDSIYPSINRTLADKIEKQGGAVISEYLPSVVSKPFRFPIRNRIIAGLSKGTLVVSAGRKSGTLYTAQYAGEYGRDLFAVPYSVGVSSGEGCNELIKRGAVLTDTPNDILDYYGVSVCKREFDLSSTQRIIIKALENGAKHIEILSAELQKQTFELLPDLSVLEINGIVVKSGNFFQLTQNISEE